ncbi:hypothetical protein CEP53_010042 [Fusarium sp. AF-6]|nr:hypothetical protein CEP53_010042 [Fusarium sp. AF-6]
MKFKTEPVKTEPVKAERAMKKEEFLTPNRELPSSHDQAIKAEAPVASSDEGVVFLSAAPRPSARPLGRCSCDSSFNHASTAIATTTTIKADTPSVTGLGSQDVEVGRQGAPICRQPPAQSQTGENPQPGLSTTIKEVDSEQLWRPIPFVI